MKGWIARDISLPNVKDSTATLFAKEPYLDRNVWCLNADEFCDDRAKLYTVEVSDLAFDLKPGECKPVNIVLEEIDE